MSFLSGQSLHAIEAKRPIFRATLYQYPAQMDPRKVRTSGAQHFLPNLYRGLFRYKNENSEPSADLAKKCFIKNKVLVRCDLQANQKWSDGSLVTALDVIKSLQEINKKPHEFPLSKRLEIIDFNSLKAISDFSFEFKIKKPLSLKSLQHQMTSMVWWPYKEDIFSNAFQIQKGSAVNQIRLIPNSYFSNPPKFDILFEIVSDDSLALKLYEVGKIDFVRRVPTQLIPKLKNQKDFHEFRLLRFDHYGFSQPFSKNPLLRKWFSEKPAYSELQKLFSSYGRPGCWQGAGIIYEGPEICLPEKQKALFPKGSSVQIQSAVNFYFSSLGAEDHLKAGEWLRAQWIDSISLIPRPLEPSLFFKQLKQGNDFFLFRKGVAAESLECEDILHQLLTENSFEVKIDRSKSCKKQFESLVQDNIMIPTGAYRQAVLIRGNFKGIQINYLNQLDLSEASYLP